MNLYQTITDRILKQLDAGQIPWRKTWTTGLPKSLTTGKEYRGINILTLASTPYASRYWVTYRQAQNLGGHVRQGEKASPVIYWKWRTPEELRQLAERTGKTDVAPCTPFGSAVFNLDQVDGLTRPADDVPCQRHARLALAGQVFDVMPDKPEIVHATAGEPAYSPRLDRITLPHLSQFETAASYFETLFHECCHATGHPRRLNRFAGLEGDRFERYSFEELVAEFGAAFLCAFAGISNPASEALQASYIAGWSRALRADSRLVFRAASAAQRAADYIRGKLAPEQITDDTPNLTSTEDAHV